MPATGRNPLIAAALVLVPIVGCHTADRVGGLATPPGQPIQHDLRTQPVYGMPPATSAGAAVNPHAPWRSGPAPVSAPAPVHPNPHTLASHEIAVPYGPAAGGYAEPVPYQNHAHSFGAEPYGNVAGCPSCGALGGCGCGAALDGGCLPRELDKVSLPTYVVEPPDILLIEAVNNLRPPGTPLRAGDPLLIRVSRAIPVDTRDDPVSARFKTIDDVYTIHSDGAVDLGPEYGRVRVAGLDERSAREAIRTALIRGPLTDPQVSVQLAEPRTRQHVAGEHLVRPDGTVSMGIYGSVYVSGLTLREARRRIEMHLARYILEPEVSVDVLAYNSKVYYVVTDGAGAGEQVFRFPCTGNETVLDAISQINGLPVVACKKHIWLARPTPVGGAEQRFAVDWDAIVRGASTRTNYQVLPGDRIYVRADDLVTFDTFVAKIVSPFERILGFVLLGHGTVRELQFGHRGNGIGGGVTGTRF